MVIIIAVTVYFKHDSNKIDGVRIIDLKSNDKHLLFYGSRHSNNKTDPMFKDIEEKFFSTNPQVVLVEGDTNKLQHSDIDSAVRDGESSFVSYLAQKNNLQLESVEPSMKDQYEYLLKKFDKNRVLLMYILRQVQQYQREQDNKPIVFKEQLQRLVNYMVSEGFPLDENEAKLESILNLLNSYLKEDINNNNWKSIDTIKYVFREGADLNGIYNEVYNFRNQYLVSTIEKQLQKYDRVFVIMGSSHVRDEKIHIEEVFGKLTK